MQFSTILIGAAVGSLLYATVSPTFVHDVPIRGYIAVIAAVVGTAYILQCVGH